MKGIYRFQQDFRRGGLLAGIFIAAIGGVEKINGQTVYFGEVLGKHSDVEVDISTEENLKLVSAEPADVETFERLELATGYNPFDYWEGDDHGDHPGRPD